MINGRSLGRDERRRGKPAETPFPAAEIGDRGAQVFGAEIGPQGFDEVELRVGGFPQQEVGEALFAAAADEQVDIAAGLALRGREETAERLARGRMLCPPPCGCVGNRIARRIIESNLQTEPRVRGRCPFRCGDRVAQAARQPVATADDREACPALVESPQFRAQKMSQQRHERADLLLGTPPIVG